MRHVDSRLPCGCHLTRAYGECRPEITFCPLHRNAIDLLTMCRLLVKHFHDATKGPLLLESARNVVSLAEAKPEKETSNA